MPFRPRPLKKYAPPPQDNRKPPAERGYDFAWTKLSRAYRMEFPFCQMCLDEGRATNGNLVDHIVPLDQGGERLEKSNLQTLCYSCHATKTHQDKKARPSVA